MFYVIIEIDIQNNIYLEKEDLMKKKWIGSAILLLLLLYIWNQYIHLIHNQSLIEFIRYQSYLTIEEQRYLEEKGQLRYIADDQTPPLRYVNEKTGQYEGIVIDYLNALSMVLGVPIETTPSVWHKAMDGVEQGEYDFIDMHPSQQRSEKYHFTLPVYYQRGGILTKVESPIKALQDLHGQKVAVIKEDYAIEHLKESKLDIQFKPVESMTDAIALLINDEVVAVVGDESVMHFMAKTYYGENNLLLLDDYIYEQAAVFAVSQADEHLINILNKGIRELNKNQTMDQIYRKWFETQPLIVKENSQPKIRWLFQSVLLLSGFALSFFFFWNRLLKQEVEKRTNELKLSKQQLEATFNSLSDHMMFVVDSLCNVTEANLSFCKWHDKTYPDLKGKNCHALHGILGCDCHRCLIQETRTEKQPLTKEVTFENKYYHIQTYPLILPGKVEELHILVVIEDVTERILNEKEMIQSSKMVALGELSAGIAHEIRTPLAIIKNHVFLLRKLHLSKEIQENVDLIDDATKRANGIIHNLLHFSKSHPQEKEKINLKSFITALYNLGKSEYKQKKIDFQITCDESLYMTTHTEPLQLILLNLFSNAKEAMEKGGCLHVCCKQDHDFLVIQVIDNGKGISKENLDRIFDPFFTTRKRKGTGLGLYISFNELKKLNGSIEVKSELNQGTTFTLKLPL